MESGARRAQLGLLLACAVVAGACVAIRVRGIVRGGGSAWALVASLLSVVLVALLRYVTPPERLPPAGRTIIILTLIGLWSSVVWATTFAGAFIFTGNGYFGAWSVLRPSHTPFTRPPASLMNGITLDTTSKAHKLARPSGLQHSLATQIKPQN